VRESEVSFSHRSSGAFRAVVVFSQRASAVGGLYCGLAAAPFYEPDLTEELNGREVAVRFFGHFTVTYWLDHRVKEVRVANIYKDQRILISAGPSGNFPADLRFFVHRLLKQQSINFPLWVPPPARWIQKPKFQCGRAGELVNPRRGPPLP